MHHRFSLHYQKALFNVLVKMHTTTIVLCIVTLASSLHLPPHIPPCKSSDESCLKSSAESAFSTLINGDKELAIPPLDPLAMDPVLIQPIPGPLNILQKHEDIVIGGLSKAEVSKFTVDLKACHIFMEINVPMLQAKSKYEIKGQLLLFPVDTKGNADAKLKNFLIQVNVDCEKFKDQDIEFLRVTSSKVTFSPKEAEFHLGNLINGNEQLEKEVHKVIDDDPLAFFDLIRPGTEQLWSSKVKEIVNDFLTKVPTHGLFKD